MDSTFLAQIFVSVVSKSFHSMIAALLKLCPGWILTKEGNLGGYKSTEWFRQQHCTYVHQEREVSCFLLPPMHSAPPGSIAVLDLWFQAQPDLGPE